MTRILASMVLGFAALAAHAAGESNVDGSGLALKGYDPVSYFVENKPVKGRTEFTAQHEGATYRFASAANRDTFTAAPAKYRARCLDGGRWEALSQLQPVGAPPVVKRHSRLPAQGRRELALDPIQMRKMGSVPILGFCKMGSVPIIR